MVSRSIPPLAALALGVLCAGCGDDVDVFPTPGFGIAGPAPTTLPPEVTYYEDVKPLLSRHCESCHGPDGGIQPRLDSYADAARYASMIVATLDAGTMPPGPSSSGQDCWADMAAPPPADEVEHWIAAGLPSGNPDSFPPPLSPPDSGTYLPHNEIWRSAATLYPPEGGGSRCARIGSRLTTTRFAEQLSAAPDPGTRGVLLVHVYAVAEPWGAELGRLDAEDDEPGWACRQGPGVGVPVSLAHWHLRGGEFLRPPSELVELAPGTILVAEVHFSEQATPYRPRLLVQRYTETPSPDHQRSLRVPLFAAGVTPPDSPVRAIGPLGDWWVDGVIVQSADPIEALGISAGGHESMECLLDLSEIPADWFGHWSFGQSLRVSAGDLANLTCTGERCMAWLEVSYWPLAARPPRCERLDSCIEGCREDLSPSGCVQRCTSPEPLRSRCGQCAYEAWRDCALIACPEVAGPAVDCAARCAPDDQGPCAVDGDCLEAHANLDACLEGALADGRCDAAWTACGSSPLR